jgi:hypothetical protein
MRCWRSGWSSGSSPDTVQQAGATSEPVQGRAPIAYLIRIAALAALAAAVPVAAGPGDVGAQAFYAKAMALKAKGAMALFSGDVKPMKAQMLDAGARVRAENLAAKKRGSPLYCPPAKAKGGVDFVLDGLGKIPESRRRQLTLTEAWREVLIARFPC